MNYWILAVTIGVLSVEMIAAYYFFKHYRLYRRISTVKTSRISDLSDGLHEVQGRIIALDRSCISPYTEKVCVYYDFRVEERRTTRRNPYEKGGSETQWDTLIEDEQRRRFGVDDGSGIAVVDLERAQIKLRSENEFEHGAKTPMRILLDPQRERLLKSYAVEDSRKRQEAKLRYRELLLAEGTQIFVTGDVHGTDNGRPLFTPRKNSLFVSDNSEHELLEWNKNKVAFSISIMIGLPLGLWLFWLMEF